MPNTVVTSNPLRTTLPTLVCFTLICASLLPTCCRATRGSDFNTGTASLRRSFVGNTKCFQEYADTRTRGGNGDPQSVVTCSLRVVSGWAYGVRCVGGDSVTFKSRTSLEITNGPRLPSNCCL